MTAPSTVTASTAATRVEMFGIAVDALTMEQTVDRVRTVVEAGVPKQHVVVNANKIVEICRNEPLRDIIRSCDLVNADGTSVVLASRFLRRPLPERVTGIDLFARLVAVAAAEGWRCYFLGAEPDVVAEVVDTLSTRHPTLVVAGHHHGYWQHDDDIVAAVRAARPQLLFLAIPSPRKEFWLHRHLDAMGEPFVMGVGGSYDVVAGKVKRAPVLAQRLGMEWFWRLCQEPRRLWKRYLFGNARFALLTVKEWRGARR
jgi:N-acetylglucosaminyldiphosphoundecaprenol N-acetyl-beta-D-mannosaminyltransferase